MSNPETNGEPGRQRRVTKSRRGFAAMSRDEVRQIASQGGRAAHEQGTAHEFDSEEARIAGKKGGEARRNNRNR